MPYKKIYSLRLSIDRLNIRERIMVMLACFILIIALGHGLVMLFKLNQVAALEANLAQKQQATVSYDTALASLKASTNNPNVMALRRSNERLAERIEAIEKKFKSIETSLISPGQMISLLRQLLEKENQLALKSFEVLPVVPVEAQSTGVRLFYQHSIAIELEGTFESLTQYLTEIETLDADLFWDNLSVETENFPTLNIKLQVHTLSRNERWLRV
ncbi:hypothetical protein [Reinekea thalattae]|uniref:Type 4a pilus biogenesis protein PilO n=1 Tax=Reinekea thalattae TaxID=2593301 RepID=A0A5C8ZAU1_9GAMM|nr:hypothetical protein [Reinekea thalattae]TXR54301.1 hypothetical protein FME95_07130 [Reinekea thalattae]